MKVAIVGASIGGLASAIALRKLGASVAVFERNSGTFSERGGALWVDVPMWEALRGAKMIRRGQPAARSQGSFFYGDVWNFLYSGLPKGIVRFEHPVVDLGDDVDRPRIDDVSYDLVILADGGWSKLRACVTRTQPEYSGYNVWRGAVDAAEVCGFDTFGMPKNGNCVTLTLPMCKDDGTDVLVGGLFVATPEDEIARPEEGANRHLGADAHAVPEWFLPFYRKQFGKQSGGALVRLFEAIVAKGELRPHPQYDYAADRVHAGRVVLVGDAAHLASPALAAGANTAVRDALALYEAFSAGHTVEEALTSYSHGALRRARELFMGSLAVRREFLPKGGLAAVRSPSELVGLERNVRGSNSA